MKKILSLFALTALSATMALAQTPDRATTPDNNANGPVSNENNHRAGNWGWIGLIGLAGLAGMRGRREDARNENVRMRPAA